MANDLGQEITLKGVRLTSPDKVLFPDQGVSKRALADYYFLRNRLLITRRFFPSRLPTVRFAILLALANRIRRRQWDRVRMILRLWREG